MLVCYLELASEGAREDGGKISGKITETKVTEGSKQDGKYKLFEEIDGRKY